MAFLIALMASDFSFALRQACNTSKNGKINTRSTGKPIVWTYNRSEGCGNFFLRKAPACSHITSARQSFPSSRSLTLVQGRLPEISWARRGQHSPTKPCETEGHYREREAFSDHSGCTGEKIYVAFMNLFSGPARATTTCIYVARAFGKVPQKQQAKGEPGVGLIGINHRPIIQRIRFTYRKWWHARHCI